MSISVVAILLLLLPGKYPEATPSTPYTSMTECLDAAIALNNIAARNADMPSAVCYRIKADN